MNKTILLITLFGVIAGGCTKNEQQPKPADVVSPEVKPDVVAPEVKPKEAAYPIPKEQKEFQSLIVSLPKIPRDIEGTRQEEQFIADTNQSLGDYEMVKLGGNFYVQPKSGKAGLTSITNWVCKTDSKKESDTDYGGCDLVGIRHDISSAVFWDSGSNFVPKKYYVSDVIKLSGKVKSLVIFEFGGWSYKIELVDGDFEVIQEGN